ncbi:MAG: hypothetical protein RL148_2698 [Planctomycetota bacterium]|jgi:aryl-alcohol dehydrogenase-like predicted oxidoreductase
MERIRVPGTGVELTRLGFGTWRTVSDGAGGGAGLALLHRAHGLGIRFFDLADVYAEGGAERLFGRFLAEVPRESVVVGTKVGLPVDGEVRGRGLGRDHVLRSVDASLRRIGTSWVDVYTCHREDPATPLGQVVSTMTEVVRSGRARCWGTSHWAPQTLRRAHALALATGGEPPRVEQPGLSLLDRSAEAELLPACEELGMAVTAHSVLAEGRLACRATEAGEEPRLQRLAALARGAGLQPAALALAWAVAHGGVSCTLLGASRVEQLDAAVAAAQFRLGPGLLHELDVVFPPRQRPRWLRWLRRVLRG